MSYVNFAALKAAVTITEVCEAFDIEVKGNGLQQRGQCPMCMGSDRELAINARDSSWYCHAAKLGGDTIALIAHTEGVRMKEAAEMIAERCGFNPETGKNGSKSKDRPNNEPKGFDPEKIAAQLIYEHEAVQALGLSPEQAAELWIGYKAKGVHHGSVVFPLYRDGQCAGFAGYKGGEIKLPKI